MVRPVLVLVVGAWSALAAGPALAQGRLPVACNDENGSCREDCTMEFGTSVRTRAQLGRCLEKCTATHRRCTDRWYELQHAGIEREPSPEAPRERERTIRAQPVEPPPARESEDAPAPRARAFGDEGRTRYAPDEPAPAPESAGPPAAQVRVDTEDYNAGIALPSDEQLGEPSSPPPPPPQKRAPRAEEKKPAPAATPAPKKKAHPDLPAEPEYDISDWDPDAR